MTFIQLLQARERFCTEYAVILNTGGTRILNWGGRGTGDKTSMEGGGGGQEMVIKKFTSKLKKGKCPPPPPHTHFRGITTDMC